MTEQKKTMREALDDAWDKGFTEGWDACRWEERKKVIKAFRYLLTPEQLAEGLEEPLDRVLDVLNDVLVLPGWSIKDTLAMFYSEPFEEAYVKAFGKTCEESFKEAFDKAAQKARENGQVLSLEKAIQLNGHLLRAEPLAEVFGMPVEYMQKLLDDADEAIKPYKTK